MTRINACLLRASKSIIMLAICLSLIASCKPDVVMTGGEKAAQDIQNAVGTYTKIQVYAQSTGNSNSDTALRITGQFIQVGTTNYNLNQLLWYSYTKSSSELRLRFP